VTTLPTGNSTRAVDDELDGLLLERLLRLLELEDDELDGLLDELLTPSRCDPYHHQNIISTSQEPIASAQRINTNFLE
jgi:hypothetical protein